MADHGLNLSVGEVEDVDLGPYAALDLVLLLFELSILYSSYDLDYFHPNKFHKFCNGTTTYLLQPALDPKFYVKGD